MKPLRFMLMQAISHRNAQVADGLINISISQFRRVFACNFAAWFQLLRVIKVRTTHLCCVMFTLHVAPSVCVCVCVCCNVCACWGKAYEVAGQSFHNAPEKVAGKIRKSELCLASHS